MEERAVAGQRSRSSHTAFGENGIECRKTLFVANTAFHQIIQIPVNSDRTAGTASIFMTLFLPYAGANEAIDSAWTLEVKGYTVSQLPAQIPPLNGQ